MNTNYILAYQSTLNMKFNNYIVQSKVLFKNNLIIIYQITIRSPRGKLSFKTTQNGPNCKEFEIFVLFMDFGLDAI
jgi:hypothetical protein